MAAQELCAHARVCVGHFGDVYSTTPLPLHIEWHSRIRPIPRAFRWALDARETQVDARLGHSSATISSLSIFRTNGYPRLSTRLDGIPLENMQTVPSNVGYQLGCTSSGGVSSLLHLPLLWEQPVFRDGILVWMPRLFLQGRNIGKTSVIIGLFFADSSSCSTTGSGTTAPLRDL